MKLFLIFNLVTFHIKIMTSFSIQNYDNFVIILGCDCCENDDPVPELITPIPKVTVGCLTFNSWSTPSGPRQHIRFGAQRFTHIFLNLKTSEHIISLWKEIYGQLTLTQYKLDFFDYATSFYSKYANYNPQVFLENYWRSQWNQDQFVIKDSSSKALVLNNLMQFDQLPTHLQQLTNHPPSIHQFGVLFYSPLSGWGGSRCSFYTFGEQLYELTLTYNSFDTMFCEVFKFYNLSFMTNYNFQDFVYMRSFVLRDDLISSFPSDPNALFYESPGITFIVLKQSPVVWGNIARPFELRIWIAIAACLGAIVILNQMGWKISKIFLNSEIKSTIDNLFKMNNFWVHKLVSQRFWLVFVRFYMFLLLSAYSGMILAGYLDPNYPWTPKTFAELNSTSNFYVAIGHDTAVNRDLLVNGHVLNGIKLWHYHFMGNETILNPGGFLSTAESDQEFRYALLMYSDKKNLYISSRHELYHTAKFVHRLHSDNEVVLQEMRYLSVAPGATKLHFLVDAIRQNFECGVWIRWKNLENNYFKYVAPVAAGKFVGGFYYPPLFRSLNLDDILTILCVFGSGLVIACVVSFGECCKKIWTSFVKCICFVLMLLVKVLGCVAGLLERVRNWLLNLNRF